MNHWVIFEPWCPTARVSDTGCLSIPIGPATIKVVEVVDQIIYRMMQA